jgi:hypothetical protein
MPGKLEKDIEKAVRKWTEDQGGVWIKLLADGRKGIPDNEINLPPVKIGRYNFPVTFKVELKRPRGGVLSPHQERWLNKFSKIEHPAFVCYSLEHVQEIADHVRKNIRRLVMGARAELDQPKSYLDV